MDTAINLSKEQRKLVDLPVAGSVFLEGLAGTGKTTTLIERMISLMARGVPGRSILVLLPQRTLAGPFYRALEYPGVISGGPVSILTIGGLAQRMVDLFWPVVAQPAGFSQPEVQPIFLTLETAQYYMARLVKPLLEEGYFGSVTIEPNRLFSQIIDNLNKSAVVGFPISEVGDRLKEAWIGEPAQLRVYDDVQECVNLFRKYCLENNLLDFSLQVEIFRNSLWNSDICRSYLQRTYRHILFDNLEEDTPVSHEIIKEWLPDIDSAMFVYDAEGGFRRFLGADPGSAYTLKKHCMISTEFQKSFVMSPDVQLFEDALGKILEPVENVGSETRQVPSPGTSAGKQKAKFSLAIENVLKFESHRFYPDMLDWVAGQIDDLVTNQDVSPSEIVILAPFLSDALRFSLEHRLEASDIRVRSHRPSRALRDEPAARCLLTLSCLAYPEWGYAPAKFDVVYALSQSILDLDLIRARLLVDIVYRVKENKPGFSSFDQIRPEIQERITYTCGERFEQLKAWLKSRREPPDEYDQFLSRLFGELLSQPGFGFHDNLRAAEITANLIESVQKFRWVAGKALKAEGDSLGREYFRMVQDGVLAAQYIRSWSDLDYESILIAPAYTFLLANRPTKVQFWLDVGSRGWSERLDQPLTHPYVLSRNWSRGEKWSDINELEVSSQLMSRVTGGLLRRCGNALYLGLSELNEQGYELRGPLLQSFQRLLRIAE